MTYTEAGRNNSSQIPTLNYAVNWTEAGQSPRNQFEFPDYEVEYVSGFDRRNGDIQVVSSRSNFDRSPDGELASLSSVYLNQVPYTGPEDTAKVAGFIALLIVWSSFIAYYVLRKRKKAVASRKVAAFKEANRARMNA